MTEPPPMSDALRALVEADAQRPGAPDNVRRGVYAALGVTVGVIPAGVVVATNAAAATTTAAASASGGATGAAAATAAAPVALLAKLPLIGVGLGAVLGASLTAYVVKGPASRSRPPAPAAVADHATRAPRAPAPPVVTPEPQLAPPVVVVAPPARRPAPEAKVATRPAAPPIAARAPSAETPAPAAAPPAGALAAEQALLDPARVALARGDAASALARLETHERKFPAGALAQEREAMSIRALVLAGDRGAAETRASRFRSRYPGSLLAPVIDATLR